jgi:hypothetical protein
VGAAARRRFVHPPRRDRPAGAPPLHTLDPTTTTFTTTTTHSH